MKKPLFEHVEGNIFKLIPEGEFLHGPFFDDDEEEKSSDMQFKFLDKADLLKKIENQPPADEYEIGKDLAIKLFKKKWWLNKNPEEIALVQLYIKELCMDFGAFHEAVEQALGHAVYTHEFAYERAAFQDKIVRKYFGGKSLYFSKI
jgi:hypothetical protein